MPQSPATPFAQALFPLEEAARRPPDPGNLATVLFRHGTMVLEYYKPQMPDPQKPHTRDELYFVAAGEGWFRRGTERFPCKAGDVLFVAAGVEHRFEECSGDFGVWVVFYGAEGGEAAQG